ncbi:MAG TPA: complex I NDUFA9 subunit family protein, partial [Gemmatimonadales bacterium]|nr:complex I NDUFA9 subunit family protein [Gemmatimonadales bacterium]
MAVVAITGATGFVGRDIVREVLARGHGVRLLARDPARLPFTADGLTVVPGTLADAAAIARLVGGADAVIHLVGIIAETGDATFKAVHVEGARTVARAARTAGVRRLVHMSAVGARHDPDATAYHRSKAVGEDEVRQAGIPHVILRPAVIVGRGSVPIALLARLHGLLPAIPVFGAADFPMQPVWIGDVATAFAMAAEGTGADGAYELGGPDRITYEEFVRAIGRAVGHPRPLVRVPLGLARFAASAFDVLPPSIAPITSQQLQMLVEGSATPDNAIERVFGIRPLGFEAALERSLRGDGGRGTG